MNARCQLVMTKKTLDGESRNQIATQKDGQAKADGRRTDNDGRRKL